MCAFIKHTICDSLMKIQFLKQWSTIVYENSIKIKTLHKLHLHLALQYIKMSVLIWHTLCKSLVKICAIKRKCLVHFFVIFFLKNSHVYVSVDRQCCRPVQKTVTKIKNLSTIG